MAATVRPATLAGSTTVETVSPQGLDLQERVVEINRVAKVVKGGRRFSFTALVVVGDEDSRRRRSATARPTRSRWRSRRRVENATKNLIRVPKYGQTITHQIDRPLRRRPRRAASPASPGTGVIAGGGVRAVLELGGHPRRAHQEHRHPEPDQPRQGDDRRACSGLRRPEEVAELRGLTVTRGARDPRQRRRRAAGGATADRPRRAERRRPRPPPRPRRRAGGRRPREAPMADAADQAGRVRERQRARSQRDTLRSLRLGAASASASSARTPPQLRGMIRTVEPPRERRGRRESDGTARARGRRPAHPDARSRARARPRKRVGRGEGSGYGKTSGRGHKGAGAALGRQAQGRATRAARTRSTCGCASCAART